MKKCKFIKSGIAIAILGCSIIFTACDVNTDKKVEKQANKAVSYTHLDVYKRQPYMYI